MKKLTLIIFSLLAGLLLLILIWTGDPLTGEERAWLKRHGTIKVAASNDYPPLNFVDHSGKAQGISIEYWRLLAEKLDLEVEFVTDLPFSNQLEGLKNGRFDSLVGIFPLKERAEFFDFSQPYMNINTYIYVRPLYAKVTGFKDLRGLKVGVVKDDSGQILSESTGLKPITFINYPNTIMALAKGEIDAMVMDEPVVSHFTTEYKLAEKIKRVGHAVDQGRMILPVRKGRGMLLDILNKGVAAISPEELRKISIKWFTASPLCKACLEKFGSLHNTTATLSEKTKPWGKSF